MTMGKGLERFGDIGIVDETNDFELELATAEANFLIGIHIMNFDSTELALLFDEVDVVQAK